MAVYLRPYDTEPVANASELREAANLLSDEGYPLSLIRAINGEALIREGAQTRKGRTLVRLILAFFEFESWYAHEAKLPRWLTSRALPLWRLANRLQDVRRRIEKAGW
jgi:hypothetical protein